MKEQDKNNPIISRFQQFTDFFPLDIDSWSSDAPGYSTEIALYPYLKPEHFSQRDIRLLPDFLLLDDFDPTTTSIKRELNLERPLSNLRESIGLTKLWGQNLPNTETFLFNQKAIITQHSTPDGIVNGFCLSRRIQLVSDGPAFECVVNVLDEPYAEPAISFYLLLPNSRDQLKGYTVDIDDNYIQISRKINDTWDNPTQVPLMEPAVCEPTEISNKIQEIENNPHSPYFPYTKILRLVNETVGVFGFNSPAYAARRLVNMIQIAIQSPYLNIDKLKLCQVTDRLYPSWKLNPD